MQKPENGEVVTAAGDFRVAIYFERDELIKRSSRCIFDDPCLKCERYPWKSDSGPEADVFDEANGIVFRRFRRHGPFQFGEPMPFATYDVKSQGWQWRGTFVSNGSTEGVTLFSLTSIEPWDAQGDQRQRLDARILDDCNFSRLTQCAVATKRDSLSRFQQIVFASDDRLAQFRDHLRSYKIDRDGQGRGFDYVPAIATEIR